MDAYILLQIQDLLEFDGSKAKPPIKTADFASPLRQPFDGQKKASPEGQKEEPGDKAAKIKEYEIQLEYHKKMVKHFTDLIQEA